jgi:alcohol dehydrogenase class IV
MQEIVQGIEHLPEIMARTGKRKILLVTDASFPFLSIKEEVEALAVEKVPFSDFTSNPLYEDICKGIRLFQNEKCEALLAVGGGSAIDVAKCIKMAVLGLENTTGKSLFEGQQAGKSTSQQVNGRSSESKDVLAQSLPSRDGRRAKLNESTSRPVDLYSLPLIAIPTTAGTGSESTHNAVMYYEGAKQTMTNDTILPDYALLEPAVLKTLPLYQKKCTMLDALCQGIESWWSVNSTDESKSYARQAVERIVEYWHSYIVDNDAEAAAQIMWAANYAGRAINISATTAAHAMSYKITSLYGLPHGHAVAVCLPEIWEYMLSHPERCIDPRGEAYILDIFQSISQLISIQGFRKLMDELGMQQPVSRQREEELTLLSRSVNPVRMKNNPVAIDEQQARKLYEAIIK